MAYTLSNMNMNSAMSQAMNMFGHYNQHQEYILQELNPLMKQPKPEPAVTVLHVQHNPPSSTQAPPQNNMPHECQTCHRRFAQKQTLIQHMTTHTGIKAFQCQLCFKDFTQQGSLQRHMAIHNNERPYPCEVCHKSFRQKSHLTNHAKSHVDQRMYKCNLCTKSFNRADHCKRHMLTHSNTRPIYTCFFCNKEFKEKYLMKTHIKKKLCFHEATRTRRKKEGGSGPPREKPKREKFLFQCDHCYKNFQRSTKEFSNKYLEKYCKNCCPINETEKFSFFEEEVFICTQCNIPPFTKFKTYNRHMALHSEDRKFECEICHLRFQKKYLLRYHLNVHNNVKDYQCQLCGLQFETMIKLRDHYCHHVEHAEYLATIMKIYQCHHCSKLFVRRTNCVKHVRSHMNLPRRPKGPRPKHEREKEAEERDLARPNPNRVVLNPPNKPRNNISKLKEYDHFLSKNNANGEEDYDDDHFVGDDNSYVDDDDDESGHATSTNSKNFNSQSQDSNYYNQYNNYYSNKSGANQNQGQVYQQGNQYNQSSQNYNNLNQNGNQTTTQPGTIPISSLPIYNQSRNIIVHGPVEIEHHDIEDLVITSKPRDDEANPAPFHCYVCKKKYRHKKQLVRHFQVNHTNNYDKVICDICNKEFTHKSSLVEHKLLHLPPKHECPICHKRFKRKYSLKRHTLLHKGDKPFHCNQCEASFNHKKSLEIHLLKHQGILPYECNICNKRYVDKGTLSRHYLVHSGERKFVCHLCDLRFSQKIHLSKHYLTHDEIEKKLVLDCPVCGKKFYTKFNFGRHLETHNKKKQVTCKSCDKTFKYEKGYQRHLEKGKCKGKTESIGSDRDEVKPKRVSKSGTKRRRKIKQDSSELDSSDEDYTKAKKRGKRRKTKKKKKRKKRKYETTSESEEGEEQEIEEENEEEDNEGAEEEILLKIKSETADDNEEETPDVKSNITIINPDYAENFDSEVEELSSTKRLKKEQYNIKSEQYSTTATTTSAALLEQYSEDEYIVPSLAIETQQFNVEQPYTGSELY